MAASVFHSGFFGNLSINGAVLPVKNYQISNASERCLFKNSKTGDIPVPEGTYKAYQLTGKVDFDFANDPFTTAPNLVPGQQITNIIAYLCQSVRGALDGLQYTATNGFVDKFPINVDVNANTPVDLSIDIYLYGTVVLP